MVRQQDVSAVVTIATVTVAIVTYESNDNLWRVIQSIVNSPTAPANAIKFSILIIDNSQRATAKAVFEQAIQTYASINIEYLTTPQNNMGLARSVAIEHSKTEWVAFVDSDCVVGCNWLLNLLTAFHREKSKNQKLCAVGGSNCAPSDQSDFYAAVELMKKVIWGNLNSTQLKVTTWGKKDKYVDHLSTTNVLYERQAVLNVGNFSVLNKVVGEDLDLNFRLKKAGGVLLYTPQARVLHYESATLSKWSERAFRFGQAQVHLIFNQGWSHILNRRVLWPNIFVLLFCSCIILAATDFRFIFLPLFYATFIFASSLLLCLVCERPKLTVLVTKLFFISHFCYAFGQHWAVIKKIRAVLMSKTLVREANEFS